MDEKSLILANTLVIGIDNITNTTMIDIFTADMNVLRYYNGYVCTRPMEILLRSFSVFYPGPHRNNKYPHISAVHYLGLKQEFWMAV